MTAVTGSCYSASAQAKRIARRVPRRHDVSLATFFDVSSASGSELGLAGSAGTLPLVM